MVAVDETFLSLLFYPEMPAPDDPTTGRPIEYLDERIEALISQLEEQGETILIPTPVLCEFLYLADEDGPDYLAEIANNSLYKIGDFDSRAAIELAALHRKFTKGKSKRKQKREDTKDAIWAKISFDRQLVAIAKIYSVRTIYSDDKGVKTFAERNDITVIRTWELPRPPGKQMELYGKGETTNSKDQRPPEGGLSENGS